MFIYIDRYINICMYIYIYVYTYICVYIYINIYTEVQHSLYFTTISTGCYYICLRISWMQIFNACFDIYDFNIHIYFHAVPYGKGTFSVTGGILSWEIGPASSRGQDTTGVVVPSLSVHLGNSVPQLWEVMGDHGIAMICISMDWLKEKSTGNHRFSHKIEAFSGRFSLKAIH